MYKVLWGTNRLIHVGVLHYFLAKLRRLLAIQPRIAAEPETVMRSVRSLGIVMQTAPRNTCHSVTVSSATLARVMPSNALDIAIMRFIAA